MIAGSGRLRRIDYRFPSERPGADAFVAAFGRLLAAAAGASVEAEVLHLTPTWPAGALPTTTLALAPVAVAEVVFAMNGAIDLDLGALRLRSEGAGVGEAAPRPADLDAGERPPALPLAMIAARLAGHIPAIDHTGVNLPAALVDGGRWDALLRALGREAAVYRYPGGEPWPFVIPATDDEFADDIRDFAAGRVPKFELVHDGRARCPILQFALTTDLTRAEAEALFPPPHGVAFPDLGAIFRTVYVEPPWPGLEIRLDLNYRGPATEWDTGEWLVTVGGRLR